MDSPRVANLAAVHVITARGPGRRPTRASARIPAPRPMPKLIRSDNAQPAAATAITAVNDSSPDAASTPYPINTASVGASGTTATTNSTTNAVMTGERRRVPDHLRPVEVFSNPSPAGRESAGKARAM
ncbi:hypothetical protein AB0K14_02255 [Actinosynnema sp. NPDC050801]|uniref:hypothetical protein n=1 Tax=unclassified Actinosynnema TaxID=2637065 RepID=UPI00340B0DDC